VNEFALIEHDETVIVVETPVAVTDACIF